MLCETYTVVDEFDKHIKTGHGQCDMGDAARKCLQPQARGG